MWHARSSGGEIRVEKFGASDNCRTSNGDLRPREIDCHSRFRSVLCPCFPPKRMTASKLYSLNFTIKTLESKLEEAACQFCHFHSLTISKRSKIENWSLQLIALREPADRQKRIRGILENLPSWIFEDLWRSLRQLLLIIVCLRRVRCVRSSCWVGVLSRHVQSACSHLSLRKLCADIRAFRSNHFRSCENLPLQMPNMIELETFGPSTSPDELFEKPTNR